MTGRLFFEYNRFFIYYKIKSFMKLSTIVIPSEFLVYFIIGGISTVIDWAIFWLLTSQMHAHYQIGLISAYSTASLFHYIANKFLTFDCQSKKIASQFSLYLVVMISSLICSMGVMSLLVNYLIPNKLYARMLTTVLILLPNYLLHKYITFSKKIFLQPEAN
jgi:putative flippase GtrA